MTRADEYARYLERVSPENLDEFANFVAADVRFADPFHDVRGLNSLRTVFQQMFEKVGPVTFVISRIIEKGQEAVFVWQFDAALFGKPWVIQGMSHIKFNLDGKITEHIDYWDSGRLFLAKLPLIGRLLIYLYRRIGSQPDPQGRTQS